MLGANEYLDISIENILVPVEGSKLTGELTYKDRRGTVVDWNLSFTADGTSSSRTFRSGTAAFMAPILLQDKPIARRTLCHDTESFFAVIIWISSLDYENGAAFQAKPLAVILLDRNKAPIDIMFAKSTWFGKQKSFREWIIDYFEPLYRADKRFVACLSKLRRILYPDDDSDEDCDDGETECADPMKEGVFQMCMKEIDDYLHEQNGVKEMRWIDSHALPSRTHVPESRG